MEIREDSGKDYCNLGDKCLNYGFNYTASLCYVKALEMNPNSNSANMGLAKIIVLELEKARRDGRIR